MRRVPSRNTGPELAVRRLLHAHCYRFRLHRKDLPGSPDIYLPKYRTAVFVHGCFWHGHKGCKRATIPAARPEYWSEKIRRNRERDACVREKLEQQGCRVVTIWQCELGRPDELIDRVDTATDRGN